MNNKIAARQKMLEKIITASEDDNFVNDVNNAEDVSSFVDNFIDSLVEQHIESNIDHSLDDL